ncbi:AraC-like DNA-binding protein [Plantactinospora soyae]|uniref:AraC-like DNA-binding protein n=1 Tax=Plantactinospora soyae TaxID=1544732 RepID=A0A927M0Z7_9ACTN|nr:AraC-like DNA-binding protein [Plantactinospora soyae]
MCHPSWGRARSTAYRLDELVRLRRVRDRIDRGYAEPLDVEALARDVDMSAGQLSRQFRLAYGESPYGYLMRRRIERVAALGRLRVQSPRADPTRPVRNREALVTEPELA